MTVVPTPGERLTPQGTIKGRRMWVLQRDRERWRLGNLVHGIETPWPRGAYEADCDNWPAHRSRRDPSPAPGCHCGLYAFWDLPNLRAQWHPNAISGVIEAWGRIAPGDEGFLAQFAMPVAIDWPRCETYRDQGGIGWPPARATWGSACGEAASSIFVVPTWMEPYPGPWTDDPDGYNEAAEWVDMRVSSMIPLCEKHLPQPMATGRTSCASCYGPPPAVGSLFPGDRCGHCSPQVIPVETVLVDLERWYEADILPVDPEWGSEWGNLP